MQAWKKFFKTSWKNYLKI